MILQSRKLIGQNYKEKLLESTLQIPQIILCIIVKIKNIYGCEKEVKGCPITKDGNCIGAITDVSEKWIEGRIWSRYFKLVPELVNMNGKINSVGFEVVDMSKQ